jgi:hypothetical protein
MVSKPPITPASPTGLLRVSHHQIFRSQRALHPIERLQLLAVPRFSNDQLPAFEQIHIEDVRRLPHLPQNVVGRIHRVADRPLLQQLQPVRNLFRRSLDLRSRITRAENRGQSPGSSTVIGKGETGKGTTPVVP